MSIGDHLEDDDVTIPKFIKDFPNEELINYVQRLLESQEDLEEEYDEDEIETNFFKNEFNETFNVSTSDSVNSCGKTRGESFRSGSDKSFVKYLDRVKVSVWEKNFFWERRRGIALRNLLFSKNIFMSVLNQ
jgi:hypothetical protein